MWIENVKIHILFLTRKQNKTSLPPITSMVSLPIIKKKLKYSKDENYRQSSFHFYQLFYVADMQTSMSFFVFIWFRISAYNRPNTPHPHKGCIQYGKEIYFFKSVFMWTLPTKTISVHTNMSTKNKIIWDETFIMFMSFIPPHCLVLNE